MKRLTQRLTAVTAIVAIVSACAPWAQSANATGNDITTCAIPNQVFYNAGLAIGEKIPGYIKENNFWAIICSYDGVTGNIKYTAIFGDNVGTGANTAGNMVVQKVGYLNYPYLNPMNQWWHFQFKADYSRDETETTHMSGNSANYGLKTTNYQDVDYIWGWGENYFTYGLDTAGINDPLNIPAPEPLPDLTPNIHINFKVTDKDIEYWDTTAIPPLDNSKMTCYWAFIVNFGEGTGNILDEKVTSCTLHQFMNVSDYGLYQIRHSVLGDKDHNGIITYEETLADLTYNINIDGQTFSGGAAIGASDDNQVLKCFMQEPPYIFPEGCAKNMQLGLNKMLVGVGMITLPGDWQNATECHTFNTFDTWLHLPNNEKTVCPQFSSTIRTAVTQFLSVALGMLVLGYVLRQSERKEE